MSAAVMYTPLQVRIRQERYLTMLVAQEVADGTRTVASADRLALDRFARWHFGQDFTSMVEECQGMLAWTLDRLTSAAEA